MKGQGTEYAHRLRALILLGGQIPTNLSVDLK